MNKKSHPFCQVAFYISHIFLVEVIDPAYFL